MPMYAPQNQTNRSTVMAQTLGDGTPAPMKDAKILKGMQKY